MIAPNEVHHKVHDSTVWQESYRLKTAFPLKKFCSADTAMLLPRDFLDIHKKEKLLYDLRLYHWIIEADEYSAGFDLK